MSTVKQLKAKKQKSSKSKAKPQSTSQRSSYTLAERTADFGRKYSPPTNPPDVTAQPWWGVTLCTIRKPGDYTFSDLHKDFFTQVGGKNTFNQTDWNTDASNAFRFQVRISKATVWNLTGRLVSLVVWDIEEITYTNATHSEVDILGSWVDCGGPAHFPAVGYYYPSTHSRRVFRPDPRYQDYKILTTAASASDSILYHLKIEWRSDGTPGNKALVTNPVAERIVSRLGPKIDRVAEAVISAEKEREEKSSTVKELVVDGVSAAANYVIPIAFNPLLGTATTIASICSLSLDDDSYSHLSQDNADPDT